MIVQITTPQLELWRIGGEYVNLPHAHENEFQITVPICGTCFLTQEEKQYALAEGGGLVQHPQENHFFNIGAEAEVLIFKVGQKSLKELAKHEQLEFSPRQQFDPASVNAMFRRWMGELLACDQADRLAQEETETQVLYYLFSSLSGSHKHKTGAASPLTVSCSDPFIRQTLEYIHAHYTDDIHIDELASIALQSRFHFIRSFKSATRVTPYQYVLRLRMEEARRLLRQTNSSITDVSCNLGFSSPSQFYRAFVKAVGSTPEQYRSMHH
ncbi:helix-turn-helix domain-containing protein [Paenibacillus thalictri]|uniref:AraC family transcriptional regulator n=1 Tax=Paenibacillus thalictri TaxID=2527873 RepID=A0A4Q9DM58_9BACL|nr:AraC family transcriptional regulator [Paenibacillus thalictri]TBL72720.1 AraC family transcriptional regulator [Paenibacillus thalictri]